ncbi:aminotransferase class IV [Akkermansiaceae bacterium]|nr:aminotransferase class IV [Akkermansiaceae bacterium]
MKKAPIVWNNGQLINADQVCVSPFDLGLTVGLGVFETMAAYDGEVFMFPAHYERMISGAEKLGGIPLPEIDVFIKAMSEVIKANDLMSGRSRVRVSVSGGVNPLAGGDEAANVIVTAVPMAESAEVATLINSSYSVDEDSILSGVKSASYAAHLLAYREAIKEGADEVLLYNKQGSLAECAMSNVFLVRDEAVYTPFLSSGCLAGVTRSVVLELCEKLNLSVVQTTLSPIDVKRADEIFLTSSSREIQPAVMMDAKQESSSFPITKRLSDAYTEVVKSGGKL